MIRLLIVDRSRWMCDTMVTVLKEEPDIEVVGTATTPAEAIEKLAGCNMLIVSANLTGAGAMRIVREAVARDPSLRVLVLDLPADEECIKEYLAAGAAGYVTEDDTVEQILNKMRAAHHSQGIVDPRFSALRLQAAGLHRPRSRSW